jgi:hypothetical protein
MQTVEQSVLPLRPRLLDQVRYTMRTEQAALRCKADIAFLAQDDRSCRQPTAGQRAAPVPVRADTFAKTPRKATRNVRQSG